jgi:hypothetical protein
MPDQFDILNSDADLRVLPDIRIVHFDGSEEVITGDVVRLENGANIAFDLDENTDETTISVDPGGGNEDPYITQKFDALAGLTEANDGGNPISGPFPDPNTGITPLGDPWTFTRDSLWIGSMNNVPGDPISGAFFLVNDSCANVGDFETNDGFPDTLEARLKILDVCIPCLDCLQYVRLDDYLARINEFYEYVLNLVLSELTEPEHPDGGLRQGSYGLLPNWLSSQRYWDYLVHNSTIKLAAQSMGQAVTAATFYRNISTGDIGPVTITYVFEFLRDTGAGFNPVDIGPTPTTVEVRSLAREGEANQADLSGTPVYTLSTITATFVTPGILASGDQTYADAVLLLRELDLNDDEQQYAVRVNMSIAPTHLGVAPITKEILVFFVPAAASSSSSA